MLIVADLVDLDSEKETCQPAPGVHVWHIKMDNSCKNFVKGGCKLTHKFASTYMLSKFLTRTCNHLFPTGDSHSQVK